MSTTKSKQLVSILALVSGANLHFQNVPSIVFGGATYTLAQLVGLLQALAALFQGVNAARASYEAAVIDEREKSPPLEAVAKGFRKYVLTTFGNQPDILKDFGIEPPKTPVRRKVSDKAASVAKAKATRDARHTMGRKQRARIKGGASAPAQEGAPSPGNSPAKG